MEKPFTLFLGCSWGTTDELLAQGEVYEAGKLVKRGRPPTGNAKQRVSLRLDQEVAAELREDGPGWRTRLNTMLRSRKRWREITVTLRQVIAHFEGSAASGSSRRRGGTWIDNTAEDLARAKAQLDGLDRLLMNGPLAEEALAHKGAQGG